MQQNTHENKYPFAAGVAEELVRFLGCRLLPDPRHPLDDVSSVYFDTPERHALAEKVDSDYRKEKIRVRWYGHPVPGERVTGFLEVKVKQGGRRDKERLEVELRPEWLAEGRESLTAFGPLAARAIELGSSRRRPHFPMIVIRYRRARFIDPQTGTRIAVDWRIRVSRVNPVFFGHRPVRRLRQGVLEVKGRERGLPPVLRPIRSRLARRDAFSKYEAAWEMCHDPARTGGKAWTSFAS